MTAATKSAPVRHGRASTRATRNPNLCEKDESVDPIMHQRLIRRAQRHASRRPARQADPMPMDWRAIADRVGHISEEFARGYRADNLPLPGWLEAVASDAIRIAPVSAPGHPESLTAELEPAEEIYLAALSSDLWPADEYLDIVEDGAA